MSTRVSATEAVRTFSDLLTRIRYRGEEFVIERGGEPQCRMMTAGQGEEPVGIAAITASELLHGVHRAATAGQRQRREAFVERLLEALPVFPFDLVTAQLHASLWADLAAKGSSVAPHDLLIGATAMA